MQTVSRSSLAHGTPPNINRSHFDVPLPSHQSLLTMQSSEYHKTASASFIYLCSLTQILGDILPLVYTLHADADEAEKGFHPIECKLGEWEDSLPHYLKPNAGNFNDWVPVNGASSLWFSYLSLKLLLCRVAFRVCRSKLQDLKTFAKRLHRLRFPNHHSL